jgi:hypothetical protein
MKILELFYINLTDLPNILRNENKIVDESWILLKKFRYSGKYN